MPKSFLIKPSTHSKLEINDRFGKTGGTHGMQFLLFTLGKNESGNVMSAQFPGSKECEGEVIENNKRKSLRYKNARKLF